MAGLTRFGVSTESDLLARFDRIVEHEGIPSRSEAFRDLIRARVLEQDAADVNASAIGVLSLVYDHHKRDLQDHLTDLQHDHHREIISTTHVHIDHHRCLEVILLRGRVGLIKKIATLLSTPKGILYNRLVITTAEKA